MAVSFPSYLWSDPSFTGLSAAAQRGYLLLSALPHSGAHLRAVDRWAATCTSESPADVERWLDELREAGLITISPDGRQVYVVPFPTRTLPMKRHRRFQPHEALLLRTRVAVLTRDDFTCQMCGAQPPSPVATFTGRPMPVVVLPDGRTAELTLDHIVPSLHGGPFAVDNLRAACQPCNSKRGAA